MADSSIAVTSGSGNNVDTRTNAAGDHRQVIVVGNPSATDSVAEVLAKDPASNDLGLVVRDVNGSAMVAAIQNISIGDITRVKNVVDGTLSLVTRVDRVHNLVDGTLTTVSNLTTGNLNTVTRVDRVMNIVDGTIGVENITRVRNLVDGTLTTVTGLDRVRNVVDGTLTTVTGVDRVRNIVDGTLSTVVRVSNLIDGTVKLSSSSASMAVYFDRGTPAVNAYFNGNVAVTPNSGIPAVNVYSTTSIFTVSGSVSGSYPSGFTLVAPSANYNFKVYAYSLQTTGIVSEVFRFTNGGASATEFWRGLVTAAATTSAPVGANLAVQPPGFLFATGTSTTLALKMDTGSLVHYSVSYIKESA